MAEVKTRFRGGGNVVPGERIELPTNGLQNASGKDSGVYIGCHRNVISVEKAFTAA